MLIRTTPFIAPRGGSAVANDIGRVREFLATHRVRVSSLAAASGTVESDVLRLLGGKVVDPVALDALCRCIADWDRRLAVSREAWEVIHDAGSEIDEMLGR